jgi:hypothetical protein
LQEQKRAEIGTEVVARAGAHNRRTDIRRFRRLTQKADGRKQKAEGGDNEIFTLREEFEG